MRLAARESVQVRTGFEVDDIEEFRLRQAVRRIGIGAAAKEPPLLGVLLEVGEHFAEVATQGPEIGGEQAERAVRGLAWLPWSSKSKKWEREKEGGG